MTDQVLQEPAEIVSPAEEQTAQSWEKKPKMRSGKPAKITKLVIIYTILVLYALIIILPFFIVLHTSFKHWQDVVNSLKFELVPSMGFTGEGYGAVFDYRSNHDPTVMPSIISGFLNTLMFVLPPTIIGLLTSSIAAYAYSKLRFRLKGVMYGFLLATMMIPGTIMIVPQYSIYDSLGWVDTPLPLMIPGMFGAAACVFFMRQFYAGIPDSIVEAAKIDGLGFIGIFFRIMIPLSVPALLAQGLLGFIGGYNDYLGPLLYLQSSEMYTLQIVLSGLPSEFGEQENKIMAGAVVALLPMLVIYFICQQYFIDGIVASGLKD